MNILGIILVIGAGILVGLPVGILCDSISVGSGAGLMTVAYAMPYERHREGRISRRTRTIHSLFATASIALILALVCMIGFIIYLTRGTVIYELLICICLCVIVIRQCVIFLGLEYACDNEHPHP